MADNRIASLGFPRLSIDLTAAAAATQVSSLDTPGEPQIGPPAAKPRDLIAPLRPNGGGGDETPGQGRQEKEGPVQGDDDSIPKTTAPPPDQPSPPARVS